MGAPESGRGRVALVTGASSGLGAALARELARKGLRLALTARRADRLESLAGEARSLGSPDVLTLIADLGDPGQVDGLVGRAVAHFGGLDILVNNAGLGLPDFFGRSDVVLIREQLEVNLVAPLVLTRHALPHLIERRGIIINVGSSITSVANPILGAYGATKAALGYWNDALRRELARSGVAVCLVEPGPVRTEFFRAVSARSTPDGPAMIPPVPGFLSFNEAEVARRIARLIDHPRRRLSVPKRVVWPFRLVGGLFQVWPALGDLALRSLTGRIERDRAAGRAGRPTP